MANLEYKILLKNKEIPCLVEHKSSSQVYFLTEAYTKENNRYFSLMLVSNGNECVDCTLYEDLEEIEKDYKYLAKGISFTFTN